MLVKVLPFILVLSGFPNSAMKVIAPVPPATVWPKVLKSLLLMLTVVVGFTLVLGMFIPLRTLATFPPRTEILLLLTVWVSVPVGATLDDGT